MQLVKRYHSLATLARRLNGHGSEWAARLNDLAYMHYHEDHWRAPNGRTFIQGFQDFGNRGSSLVPMPYAGLLPPRCQWLETHNLEMLTNTTEEQASAADTGGGTALGGASGGADSSNASTAAAVGGGVGIESPTRWSPLGRHGMTPSSKYTSDVHTALPARVGHPDVL